jgi:hypothetical protein
MTVRRRFLLALMASLALHLSLVAGPAWLWPDLEELHAPLSGTPLAARLATPPDAVPLVPRPESPRKARQRRPVPGPEVVVPGFPAEADETPPERPEAAVAVTSAEGLDLREESIYTGPRPEVAPGSMLHDLPGRLRIRYRVTMGEAGLLIGQASHDWRHDGETYQLTSVAETVGLAAIVKSARVEHVSRGDVVDGRLRPREFRILRDGVVVESASFDWPAQRVRLSREGLDMALEPDTQDMMSLFGQLATMNLVDRSPFPVPVATGKKVETYEVAIDGIEEIFTPLGRQSTLHVRIRSGDREATEIWFGRTGEVARLPVKIRHVDRRGGVFDQVAESVEIEGTTEGTR